MLVNMLWFILLVWALTIRAQTVVMLPATKPTIPGTPSTITTSTNTGEPSTKEDLPVRIIDELRGLAHGVASGKIHIVGDRILRIPDFNFDGNAPRAFFFVGKGKISENGTKVPVKGSFEPLPSFHGQLVELILPDNLTVRDIDWLVLWCVQYHQNLGYVFVNKKVHLYPPQTFQLDNEVTSGPVVLVNKKTLFIPIFSYKGGHENVHFWVGNGTKPSSAGVPIPDEKGSSEPLEPYQGRNLYINLTDDITTDNIDYFGVWSTSEAVSLGYVDIKGISGVPEVPKETLNVTIMRLPKCCSADSVLTSGGCEERGSIPNFRPTIKFYEHNDTHFSNESLDLTLIEFEPYISAPKCEAGKFFLEEETEEFAILENNSLLVKGPMVSGVLSSDKFCLDYIDDDVNMRILVCVPEYHIQKAMFFTYVAFTVISTFSFAITFFLYFFWLNVEDVHRRCFTGYVFTMMITFLSLTIVQTANVENSGCEVLGFLFQISMIASFTLLGILCFDIWIIIKYIDENRSRRRRIRWYLGVAVGVPVLSFIISLSRNLTPDVPNSFFKPQYMKNSCFFDAESQRTILFYVPICVSMVVSAVCLAWSKYIIVQNDRSKQNNYFWIEKGTLYKFMFRQCLLTLVIMTISWISNVLMSFLDESSGIFNVAIIFESLQGVLIVAVFSMNHFGSTYLEKRRNNKQATNVEMSPLNQNNHTSELDGKYTEIRISGNHQTKTVSNELWNLTLINYPFTGTNRFEEPSILNPLTDKINLHESRFRWRKHLIIFLTSLMWCIEAVIHLNNVDANMLIAVDIVEASQGILVFLLFVVNRETRTQIVQRLRTQNRRIIRRKSENGAIEEHDMLPQ